MEMEGFNHHAGEEDQGAAALVLDLANAFERFGPGHTSASKRKILRVPCGYFRAPEASAGLTMRGGAAPDHHGHLARVEVELLASAWCGAGRTGDKSLPAAEVASVCG